MKSKFSRGLYFANILFIAFVILASGCATVPMAPKERDAAVKTFTPKPDKAQIYVYRNETFGSALTMTIALDGKVMGRTGPHTFFWWEVEPGIHSVTSHTENVAELIIKTESGKLYYIWQEVKMGMWTGRSVLQQVDEQAGKMGVMECELIQ